VTGVRYLTVSETSGTGSRASDMSGNGETAAGCLKVPPGFSVPADAGALLADLASWWVAPEPSWFSWEVPRRIAGSDMDQLVPEGTENPYWEIARQLPVSDISLSLPWVTGPELVTHVDVNGPERWRYFTDLEVLRRTFSWSIPSPGDIAWMKKVLGGRAVVESGAGGGYWAWQLRQAGVDVAAYDPLRPGGNWYAAREWAAVLPGDHAEAASHPDRALFLCWPSNGEPWAAEALDCHAGDLLIYAGNRECCADDRFYELLADGWEPVSASPAHVGYQGVSCILSAWRRKGTLAGSPVLGWGSRPVSCTVSDSFPSRCAGSRLTSWGCRRRSRPDLGKV
jgi:hypothetical protein